MFHHPSNESRQRHSDEQRGLYDRRQSDLTRFAVPEPVATPIHHISPALLGSKADRDAFADAMLQRERDYEEAMRGLPEPELSETDIEHMARDDEQAEARLRRRAFPVNFKE